MDKSNIRGSQINDTKNKQKDRTALQDLIHQKLSIITCSSKISNMGLQAVKVHVYVFHI